MKTEYKLLGVLLLTIHTHAIIKILSNFSDPVIISQTTIVSSPKQANNEVLIGYTEKNGAIQTEKLAKYDLNLNSIGSIETIHTMTPNTLSISLNH